MATKDNKDISDTIEARLQAGLATDRDCTCSTCTRALRLPEEIEREPWRAGELGALCLVEMRRRRERHESGIDWVDEWL